MTTIFGHICNEGDRIICRDKLDCISMNNKIASAAFQTKIDLKSLSVMSTHSHMAVKASGREKIDDFIARLKKAYGIYYSRRYYPIKLGKAFDLKFIEAVSEEDFKNKISYVCRNPVHHCVSMFPFAYPYSSAKWYFANEIYGTDRKKICADLVRYGGLSARQKKQVSGGIDLPEDWLVDSEMMICPVSFVGIQSVRDYWGNNVSNFMYEMLKKVNASDGRPVSHDLMEIRTSLARDMQVCSMIDESLMMRGIRSIHELNPDAQQEIASMLRLRGIPDEQIRRALWL